MKKSYLLFFLLVLFFSANAQYDTIKSSVSSSGEVYDRIEVPPSYWRGTAGWKKYIADNLKYPAEAGQHFAAGSEQRIKSQFIIGADSLVGEIQIIGDPGYGFKEEIIRLLRSGKKWQPGRQNGKDVAMYKREEFIFTHPGSKDTTFTVGEYSCSCKYNLNPEDDKGMFDLDEKPAQYPGGHDEWKKFLKKNLDKSLKRNDEVELRFNVDKKGDLSGYELMSRSPAQKFQEIVRVLKLSGKWFPSIQKGYCIGSSVTIRVEL